MKKVLSYILFLVLLLAFVLGSLHLLGTDEPKPMAIVNDGGPELRRVTEAALK